MLLVIPHVGGASTETSLEYRLGIRQAREFLRPTCLALALAIPGLLACTCPTETASAEKSETPASPVSPSQAQSSATAMSESGPLHLGLVLDFTGALGEHGHVARKGAELAAKHINQAGGVWGQPLRMTFLDGETEPGAAVAAARMLVEVEGAHVIIGPMGSAATLEVASQVAIPGAIPMISPTATSPRLTTLDDDDWVFRATASDAAQGPILASLVSSDGFESAAVIYRDDAYGQGLFKAFAQSYPGKVKAVGIDTEKESYLEDLRQVAGEPVLVVLTFPSEAEIFLREAIEHDLFRHFVLGDAMRTPDLMERVGADKLEGVKGTAPALRVGVDRPSTQAFIAAFREEFGQAPRLGPSPSVYDSVVCFSLAAELAGSRERQAIRDSLRAVCGAPGEAFIASPDSLAGALAAVRLGTDIDYEGAGSTVDWNTDGDLSSGLIDIWQFSQGAISSLELVPFELGP